MIQSLHLTDVTLRDGLQMVPTPVSLEQKYKIYESLLRTQVPRIEVTSFVHPQWVPQLADASDLSELVFRQGKLPLETMALVPNTKGLEKLLDYPYDWVSAVVGVSETFNKKNLNRTTKEILLEIQKIIESSKKHNKKVRVYLSTSFGCPYEKEVSVDQVTKIVRQLDSMGFDEISISDTIGVATPRQMKQLVHDSLRLVPHEKVSFHFHNTYGMGLACVQQAWELGYFKFDGTLGGLGGCPYAQGASGNLPIELVAYYFGRQGVGGLSYDWSFAQKGIQDLFNCKLNLSSHIATLVTQGANIYGTPITD